MIVVKLEYYFSVTQTEQSIVLTQFFNLFFNLASKNKIGSRIQIITIGF